MQYCERIYLNRWPSQKPQVNLNQNKINQVKIQPIDFACTLMPHKCDREKNTRNPENYVILEDLTYLADISTMQKLYVNSSFFFPQ